MPKFTYETELSLAGILSAMGMPDAFNPSAADFSGMDGSQTLFLSEVYHKAFVAVDEEGTEAAAATGGVMTTGIPVTTVEFAVDRPFLFLIRDVETGAIVFMGRVVNPSE
jgi:serpin B